MDEVRDASLASMRLELEELVLIVDEAHNLPSRIRMGMQRRLFPEMVETLMVTLELLGALAGYTIDRGLKDQSLEKFDL